jgi:hypothetical protein
VQHESTKSAAPSSSSISRVVRLVPPDVDAAVLLGIGGGYGLWVTSDKR